MDGLRNVTFALIRNFPHEINLFLNLKTVFVFKQGILMQAVLITLHRY